MTTRAKAPPEPQLDLKQLRRFTVQEYYQMAKAGILHEDDRVELIDGRVVEMAPIGSRHAGCVIQLINFLKMLLGDRATISAQNPINLGTFAEPQPDICLLQPRQDNYASGHPDPASILLLVEVSDTSLDYDKNVKLPIYARAGIVETWLVNLADNYLAIYQEPSLAGYRQVRIRHHGDTVALAALPDVTLKVDDILPSTMEPEPGESQQS